MKTDFVLKILFVNDSMEDAEQIINVLRNAGIAVRPARTTTDEQVAAALREQAPDVLLFDPDGTLGLPKLNRQLQAFGRDLALIGLVSAFDNETLNAIFDAGVRAVVSLSLPQMLLAVIRREADALNTRRQLRRLEASLKESERRCDALLDSSAEAIAYVHEGMHVRANRAYLETFGYGDFDDLLGLPILDMIAPVDADAFKALLRGLARTGKSEGQLQLQARRADGSTFAATVEFAPATFEGEPCQQIVFRRQQADPALLEQLKHDPVTGLYNRARMLESIDAAVAAAAAGASGQSLLLIEPDNWNGIVGSIGLASTDELLATFAARINRRLEDGDSAGLLAEHTFGVMLHARPDAAVRQWIAQLLEDIQRDIFDLGSQSLAVSASLGGSLLGEKNASTSVLLEQAGQALRQAQSQGGGRSDLHDPSAREKADAESERHWLEQLKRALTEDGFVLHHQQIVSLYDEEGDYAEILLRLKGPQGVVQPGFFMPIAEKHGLHAQIDRWVIAHALAALAAREAAGVPTTFFVKLTAASIQDESLLPWLANALKKVQLVHGRIVLETTESKLVTMLRPAQALVRGWKKLGGLFALEQFGSGLNSFQLLEHIDVDFLKIDRSYMAQLPAHPENQQAVAEICRQAREHHRQTIAEWVEDATSTSLLFACGVDFVQGNFLQEPQPLQDFAG